MTILQACECCLGAPLVGVAAWALLCVRRRRPARHYRVGYDALHPLPDVRPRAIPPVETRPENPMRDTLVIARPARLWWDMTERKDW